jgi:hypothetical protein
VSVVDGLAFVVVVNVVLFLVVGSDVVILVVVGLDVGLLSGKKGFFVGNIPGLIGLSAG